MDSQESPAWSPSWRKACLPCAHAKRRCDKHLPACQRCAEKKVSCQYPSGRPYARRSVQMPTTAESSGPGPLHSLRHPGAEQTATPGHLEASTDSSETGTDEELPTLDLGCPGSNDTQVANSSWFLQIDTWTIYPLDVAHHNENSSARMSDLTQFIQTIRKWLFQWVRDAHCPFLHRQLYSDSGLPTCLQNAFAAVVLYESKNDKTEEIVMGIIEEKANTVLNEPSFVRDSGASAPPSLGTAEQLARVQALSIYQIIRLFDGDIRQRAQAEALIPTLQGWNSKLWESANMDACLETSFGFGGLFSQGLSANGVHDPSGRQWRNWLLAESVRRIWLVGNYVQSVYLMMRDRQTDCSGAVCFTARRGLWDAQSAVTWMQLIQSKDPLFVRCHETDMMIPSVEAPEVDVLCLSIMGIMWGALKLEYWMSKSGMQLELIG
ncbi:hypothetical protein V8C42DRAFT_44733 [Trichoderma barbatum]